MKLCKVPTFFSLLAKTLTIFFQPVYVQLFSYFFFQNSSIESKPENGESNKSATELEEGEVEPATHKESSSPVSENFYDKKKSFSDTISCEGMLNFSSSSFPIS